METSSPIAFRFKKEDAEVEARILNIHNTTGKTKATIVRELLKKACTEPSSDSEEMNLIKIELEEVKSLVNELLAIQKVQNTILQQIQQSGTIVIGQANSEILIEEGTIEENPHEEAQTKVSDTAMDLFNAFE